MKKVLSVVVMASVLMAFGCTSSQQNMQQQQRPIAYQEVPEAMCKPDWVVNPPQSKEGFYGTGSFKGPIEHKARQMSDKNARESIAATLETKIASITKEYWKQANAKSAIEAAELVGGTGVTIIDQAVELAVVQRRHVCPDGTWYSLIFYPYIDVREKVLERMEQSIDQRQASPVAKKSAQEALDFLDAHLESAFQ